MGVEEVRASAYDAWVGRVGDARVEVTDADGEWDERHRTRLAGTPSIPGLTPMLDAGATGQGQRAVQYVPEWSDLDDYLADPSNPDWSQTVGVVSAAARGMHGGHLAGLSHGGLAPQDILIHDDEVAVARMGLSKDRSLPLNRRRWAAPDVLAGGAGSARSDVYSLGKVLEHGLAGRRDVVPQDVIDVIDRATSLDPARRPVSAQALADELDAAADLSPNRYGLAALGSSAAFTSAAAAYRSSNGTVTPIEAPDDASGVAVAGAGLAAAGVAAGAAAGTSAGGASGGGTSVGGANTSTVRPFPTDDSARRRRGLVGAGAVLLGLGAIGYAATRGGDDDPGSETAAAIAEDESTETTGLSETTVLTETTGLTETTAASPEASELSTTEPPTTAAPTTAAETTETTEATETTQSGEAVPAGPNSLLAANPLDGAAAATNFEVLHAVPDFTADVYVDGQLAAAGVESGNVLSPIPVDEFESISFFAAADDAATAASDRTDEPVLDVSDLPSAGSVVVIQPDGDDSYSAASFVSDLSPVPAGQGRLTIAQTDLAGTGSAGTGLAGTGLAGTGSGVGPLQLSIDGGVVDGLQENGDQVSVEITAGTHQVSIADSDGKVLIDESIDVPEGQLTSAFLVAASAQPGSGASAGASAGGSESGDGSSVAIAVRRVSGLQTPPAAIPSGTGGLATGEAGWGSALVAAMMAALGGSGLWLQRRMAR